MRRLTTAIFLVTAALAHGAEAQTLTFREAVSIALEDNPLIAVARNSAEIAGNNAHIGNAGMLPSVDLTASTYYQKSDPVAVPEGAFTVNSASLGASWTVFNGLGNVFRYRRLQSEGRRGEIEARNSIESVLVSVSAAYYRGAAASENLRIARDLLEISRERLERVRNRAVYGQGGTIDVLAAQVDFNSDTVTVVQAGFAWEEARREINALLDRDIDTEFDIDPSVEFIAPGDYEALRASALARNASYLSAVESVRQAKLSKKIARSAWLPRLDLAASYGYDRTVEDFGVDFSGADRGWDVRAVLSLNVFDGFTKYIDSKNASIAVRSNELLERQAMIDLEQSLASAWDSYLNSRTVLELERSNLEAARVNFSRTMELYELGRVTSTQFREAQLNLIRAETNLSTARYNAKLDEVDLLRISGRLVEKADSGDGTS